MTYGKVSDRIITAMASDSPIRVASIGLGFGGEFIPIYQAYPGAEGSPICRRSKKDLDVCGDGWTAARGRRAGTRRSAESVKLLPDIGETCWSDVLP